jgi:DNA gyrase subunit A
MLNPMNDTETLLTVTEMGYAKRTTVGEYRKASRGSVGVKAIPTDEKIGNLMKVIVLPDTRDVLGITNAGVMIRVSADEVRKTSRLAKGVRLLRLDDGQWLVDVCVASEAIDGDLAKVADIGSSGSTLIEENRDE